MTNLKNILNYRCRSLSNYGGNKTVVGKFWLLRRGDGLSTGVLIHRGICMSVKEGTFYCIIYIDMYLWMGQVFLLVIGYFLVFILRI